MEKLLDQLKKLNLPTDQFVIFGSGPLGIRHIREVHDLDLVVEPELWEILSKKYPVIKENNNEKIKIGDYIDICRNIRFGFDIQKVIATADIIEGVRFVNMETTIEWKRKCGREKDFKDIELIRQYLQDGGF